MELNKEEIRLVIKALETVVDGWETDSNPCTDEKQLAVKLAVSIGDEPPRFW